jgi:cyclomaltodextrinase / maltogenic alpha-amylase / neopullulanase
VASAADTPAWVERAVVYGVVPAKFGDAGFRSVGAQLDDLADLGIDALWLPPLHPTPPGDFGYAVMDYFGVRADYGTEEDFRALIHAAHARSIRVLMDFVPNHTSAEHPWFRDALARGPASPTYAFYDRDPSGAPTHYFDWTHLPNLNYDHPEVRRTMLDAFASWVRGFDVDGFRVDAAWGVKQRRPDFWPVWRQELKRLKPGLLLLAEASARDPYYPANGFDAAYDWTDELGHWAWEEAFADGADPARITAGLRAALVAGTGGLVFRFLNNNDTGERFVARHGPALTRVAAALLLTLPGLPCLYTGDEIGAAYHPYRDPAPLDWDADPHRLRPYYRSLIELRRRLPSLHSRAWTLLDAEPAARVLAYARGGGGADPPALVLLNFGGEPVVARVAIPDGYAALTGPVLTDVLAGETLAVGPGPRIEVEMAPWTARILIAGTKP